jgi:hypothetical protein
VSRRAGGFVRAVAQLALLVASVALAGCGVPVRFADQTPAGGTLIVSGDVDENYAEALDEIARACAARGGGFRIVEEHEVLRSARRAPSTRRLPSGRRARVRVHRHRPRIHHHHHHAHGPIREWAITYVCVDPAAPAAAGRPDADAG